MSAVRSFQASEVVIATGLAIIIEATLAILLVTANNHTRIKAKEDVTAEPEPIEVKPVLDELPLLKLGSKKMRAKLPDMWVKKPPIKRYEAASAPSPKAEAVKEKIPDTPLVKPSAQPPPPDAAIAKRVEEIVKTPDAGRPKKVAENLPTEGVEDGVKDGTETDPMKGMARSLYRSKIVAWFNSKFKPPVDQIPCDELKKLSAAVNVNVNVGGERTVSGFNVLKPSGNEIFDGRVRSTLEGIVSSGAELPPPPPNYPELLNPTLSFSFHTTNCK